MSGRSERRWSFHCGNLRALQRVEWSPSGVSCLVGSNGSGKSTLLQALRFLKNMVVADKTRALMPFGTTTGLLREGADSPLVIVGLDFGGFKWGIALPIDGPGVHMFHGEALKLDEKVVFDVKPYANGWEGRARGHDERSCLRIVWDRERSGELQPLIDFVSAIQVFQDYRLHHVRSSRPTRSGQEVLDDFGGNLAYVLAAWRAAPRRFADRFDWVREAARRAFPDIIADIELDLAADVVSPYFVPPGGTSRLPFTLAADGMLMGLLHLTAVAGAAPGSIVAIDEIENHLHPHAIRSILASMRERAEEHDLSVIVTTHSPVLLDQFDGYRDHLFVLQPSLDSGTVPSRVDQLLDATWLANFSLGKLYDREDVGAPRGET